MSRSAIKRKFCVERSGRPDLINSCHSCIVDDTENIFGNPGTPVCNILGPGRAVLIKSRTTDSTPAKTGGNNIGADGGHA